MWILRYWRQQKTGTPNQCDTSVFDIEKVGDANNRKVVSFNKSAP
jgi:hypothetical protein